MCSLWEILTLDEDEEIYSYMKGCVSSSIHPVKELVARPNQAPPCHD